MDLRVRKILQMMRDNLNRELSLDRFAQAVNVSVWRLCHIFKSDVGTSPIRYLRLLRLEKAKQLLETSFLSIKEITHWDRGLEGACAGGQVSRSVRKDVRGMKKRQKRTILACRDSSVAISTALLPIPTITTF